MGQAQPSSFMIDSFIADTTSNHCPLPWHRLRGCIGNDYRALPM